MFFVVMDGVGIGSGGADDAVAQAYTPTLDWLRSLPSATSVAAHGPAVGMPGDKDMGNSEVGHNAIGAGRVFDQGAKLVAEAIATGAIFTGETWQQCTAKVRSSGQALHFIGLLSDGNVHSHIDHLLAMIDRCAEESVNSVRVHVLLDGRDVGARTALEYLEKLEGRLSAHREAGRDYRVASGGGRMKVTMDRYEGEWAMVERGWQAHVLGEGRRFASASEAVQTMYDELGVDDQWLDPFVVADDSGPVGTIEDGAAVIFFNFRGDRAIEISQAFEQDDFTAFDRKRRPDVLYAGMMQYDGDLALPANFLVDPPAIDRSMGEILAANGARQLAIAETHKYGHVTYFWNGNRSGKFEDRLENYVEVASDAVPIEQRPWMKSGEVTDRLLAEVAAAPYDLVRVNYANGDMVGHTGDLRATRMAVEAVDLCLARLVEAARRTQGVLLVTADHGNADHMFDEKKGARVAKTSHSLNRVPLAVYDPRLESGGPALLSGSPDADAQLAAAGLGNLAATAFELLGYQAPEGYLPSLLART